MQFHGSTIKLQLRALPRNQHDDPQYFYSALYIDDQFCIIGVDGHGFIFPKNYITAETSQQAHNFTA